jgi:hypothetical protein
VTGDFALLLGDLRRAGFRLRRAWPRDRGHLLLDLDRDDVPGDRLAGQWFADPASAERTTRRTPGARQAHRLVLQPAGADRVLTGLAPLLAAPDSRLVGHRPERRAVVALDGGRRFAKLVPTTKLARLRHGCARTDRLPVRTARLLPERSSPVGTVTTEALAGTPLTELLGGSRAGEALVAVGAAVAALHQTAPPAGSPVHGPADEVAVTRTWEQRARDYGLSIVAESGRDRRPPPPRALGLIHRDLHDGQLVLSDDGGFRSAGVGLLDFDLMAAGDPALDLANLIEHLRLRARQGVLADADGAVAALLEGYRPDPDTLGRVADYRSLTARRLAAVYAFRAAGLAT